MLVAPAPEQLLRSTFDLLEAAERAGQDFPRLALCLEELDLVGDPLNSRAPIGDQTQRSDSRHVRGREPGDESQGGCADAARARPGRD